MQEERKILPRYFPKTEETHISFTTYIITDKKIWSVKHREIEINCLITISLMYYYHYPKGVLCSIML